MDGALQFGEESGCVGAIHLCVVELEGEVEGGFGNAFAVASPDKERIVEDAAIHPDSSVDVILRES